MKTFHFKNKTKKIMKKIKTLKKGQVVKIEVKFGKLGEVSLLEQGASHVDFIKNYSETKKTLKIVEIGGDKTDKKNQIKVIDSKGVESWINIIFFIIQQVPKLVEIFFNIRNAFRKGKKKQINMKYFKYFLEGFKYGMHGGFIYIIITIAMFLFAEHIF